MSNDRKWTRISGARVAVALLFAGALLAGCKPPDDLRSSDLDQSVPTEGKTETPQVMAFSAGVPVQAGTLKSVPAIVSARPNPFALTPTEASFDRQQTAAYLATNEGHFPLLYQAPPENLAPPEVEPQPYRRLAGILIGDSITALIDMGNGRIEEIHPGEIIPGTQWMVTSIDAEKAVLRRVGSNRLPHEVIVRLESAPANETPQQPTGTPPNGAPFGGGNGLPPSGAFGGRPGFGGPPGMGGMKGQGEP